MNRDLNRLSHWFPKLLEAGIPVPETRIVKMERATMEYLARLLFDGMDDGRATLPENVAEFLSSIERAVHEVGGYPAFLRTDMTSGKHDWEHTCFLEAPGSLMARVVALIEHSEMADMMGLPWDTWAVREMLRTTAYFHAFRGMPITKEFRVFARDGEVLCRHPYWPAEAIEGHTNDPYWAEKLDEMNRGPRDEAQVLASAASRVLPGRAWSIDSLRLADGRWVVIDMAIEETSWHWPGCERAPKEK